MILAVDPGDTKTGFVLMSVDKIIHSDKVDNEEFLKWILTNKKRISDVCIEMPVIFGNSMHIRNTILFSGQLIQYLRHLDINYYSGLTRRSVTAMFLKKAFVTSDLELSVIKSNDVLLKIIMKRIYGANMPVKSNDEIQALALYQCYINKIEEGKIDDRYINNFQFPIPSKQRNKIGKRNKRNIRTK